MVAEQNQSKTVVWVDASYNTIEAALHGVIEVDGKTYRQTTQIKKEHLEEIKQELDHDQIVQYVETLAIGVMLDQFLQVGLTQGIIYSDSLYSIECIEKQRPIQNNLLGQTTLAVRKLREKLEEVQLKFVRSERNKAHYQAENKIKEERPLSVNIPTIQTKKESLNQAVNKKLSELNGSTGLNKTERIELLVSLAIQAYGPEADPKQYSKTVRELNKTLDGTAESNVYNLLTIVRKASRNERETFSKDWRKLTEFRKKTQREKKKEERERARRTVESRKQKLKNSSSMEQAQFALAQLLEKKDQEIKEAEQNLRESEEGKTRLEQQLQDLGQENKELKSKIAHTSKVPEGWRKLLREIYECQTVATQKINQGNSLLKKLLHESQGCLMDSDWVPFDSVKNAANKAGYHLNISPSGIARFSDQAKSFMCDLRVKVDAQKGINFGELKQSCKLYQELNWPRIENYLLETIERKVV